MKGPLKAEQLRRIITPDEIRIGSIAEVQPVETIIGQERAVQALKTGLGITALGFNVYVAGQPGTGRLSAVEEFLEVFSKRSPVPDDWVYVNNFRNPYRPCALRLPTGKAVELREDMQLLVREGRSSLKKSFESDEYSKQREELFKELEKIRGKFFDELQQKARDLGFQLHTTSTGTFAIPLKEDGEQMTDEEFAALSGSKQDKILQRQTEVNTAIKQSIRKSRKHEKEINRKLEELKQQTALNAIGIILEEVKEKYQKLELEDVVEYLEAVKSDILNNVNLFVQGEQQISQLQLMMGAGFNGPGAFLKNYEVNVLVNNSELKQAPVVVEQNPTYNNLFGKIEKESKLGTLVTDFTLIREGALHRANGGYLVIPILELLRNPFAYESLKRTLVANQIEIEEISERMGFLSSKGVSPESIPLSCKVILVGDPITYRLLYEYDPDFKEHFKIVADFDVSMDYSKENIESFTRLISKICKEGELLPLDQAGLVKITEYGIRLAGSQNKLSTQFGEIADILREAHHHATQNEHTQITGDDITHTVDQKHYRSGLLQEKIRESIREKTIFIDIKGQKVGQVNGLSVMVLGDLIFGRPVRITASTRLGQEGVIDIEREVELGGKIHSKGVMILNGYLAETFGQDFPISLSASIVFEQSYGEVEGDSASSTELYALLSSLAGVSINQGIAVTGSVNQKGEVQAVGGINEKIEGYFEVCKVEGLTGEQGVLIPSANQKHLMLKDEVLEAVTDGLFKIWGVAHIDEGIEILTGVNAGKWKDSGFEKDSVKRRVYDRLQTMAEKMRDFARLSENTGTK